MVVSNFRNIHIDKFSSTIKKISGIAERILPDIVMISHSSQYIDTSKTPPQIPDRIFILWIEIVKTSFRGFPKLKDVKNVLCHTLTLKDL